MKVFGFDLLAYPGNLDHLKDGPDLPWPLPGRHFDGKVTVQNYEEHLEAWTFMEDLGFDGVGFNEHHGSPYSLMTSPNIMAAALSQEDQENKDPHLGKSSAHPRAPAPGGGVGDAGLPLRVVLRGDVGCEGVV